MIDKWEQKPPPQPRDLSKDLIAFWAAIARFLKRTWECLKFEV